MDYFFLSNLEEIIVLHRVPLYFSDFVADVTYASVVFYHNLREDAQQEIEGLISDAVGLQDSVPRPVAQAGVGLAGLVVGSFVLRSLFSTVFFIVVILWTILYNTLLRLDFLIMHYPFVLQHSRLLHAQLSLPSCY